VAFRAALELLKDAGKYDLIEEVYNKCKLQEHLDDKDVKNFVKEIYEPMLSELETLNVIFTEKEA
jgi:amidophosphoribosyltransferase